jgi:peptidoglycan/LPS O-acetylase OafA/YrhL
MAGRVQQLDVLRGVAVLLVLVHHSPGGEGALLKAGWTGVDLFFVLSGFLVSGLLFKEHLRSGRIRPGRFYLRRGLKIYPNFYVMLAVTSAALALGHIAVEPWNVVHEAVFLQNYLPAAWWGREHAWSLAIEEHFYFLLPPVLILLLRWGAFRRAPVRWAAVLAAALGTAALAVRWAMVRSARPPSTCCSSPTPPRRARLGCSCPCSGTSPPPASPSSAACAGPSSPPASFSRPPATSSPTSTRSS